MKNAKAIAGILAILSITGFLLVLFASKHPQEKLHTSQTKKLSPSPVYTKNATIDLENNAEDSDGDTDNLVPSPPDPRLLEEVRNWGRTPIVFYGKVVDDKMKSVNDALIRYSTTDLSSEGRTMRETRSSSDGTFSIQNVHGKNLVVRVSKAGYYEYQDARRGFQYAGPGDHFTPNKDKPEIFRLYKKGQQAPLLARQKLFTFPPDGSFHSLLLFKAQRKEGTLNDADLLVSFRRDRTQPRGSQSWSLLLQVPEGGGLIESNEEFMFLAPEAGYQTNVQLGASTSGDVQKQYYLRLPNNEGYARLKMTIIPDYNETGALDLNYAINPTPSRILEADEQSWFEVVSKGQGAIELILRHKPKPEDTQ